MIGLLLILLALMLIFATYAGFSGAPWVPVRKHDINEIIDDCKLNKNDLLVELGCGEGRFIKEVSRRGVIAIGYEINPILWTIAKIKSLNQKNMRVVFGNMWTADISNADAVMAFLVPKTMPKLEKKTMNEMKSGSILISYIFKMPGAQKYKKSKSWYVYKID